MNISCLYYRVYNLCVADIMKKNIFYVTYRSTYKDLKELLDQSDIRSYPLVDDKGKSCKLVSNLETEFKDKVPVYKGGPGGFIRSVVIQPSSGQYLMYSLWSEHLRFYASLISYLLLTARDSK